MENIIKFMLSDEVIKEYADRLLPTHMHTQRGKIILKCEKFIIVIFNIFDIYFICKLFKVNDLLQPPCSF